MKSSYIICGFIAVVLLIFFLQGYDFHNTNAKALQSIDDSLALVKDSTPWQGTNSAQLPITSKNAALIRYGYNLVTHTDFYLGPNGTISKNENVLTCQNCHLEAGTKPYGNNFGKVFATYPLYRSRNCGVQTIMMRIQDCFVRSMNGKLLDSSTKEMKAIYAYIQWLGDEVPKNSSPIGTKLPKLALLDRAADPIKGATIYKISCQSCHGENGAGQYDAIKNEYNYPPLWGDNSFNDGAGMYRIGEIASFIHFNMPNGTRYNQPSISEEDSWDVAAYILSQPRPHFDQINDYKIIAQKPIDDPEGPYIDGFSELQHKYGPFGPIKKFYSNTK